MADGDHSQTTVLCGIYTPFYTAENQQGWKLGEDKNHKACYFHFVFHGNQKPSQERTGQERQIKSL